VNSKLAGPKDFWIGLIYLGFGGLALYLGWDYKFGTAGRMGPGYFPLVLAWMLVGLGFASVVRSFFVKGSEISEIQWLPLALITTSVVVFAFLLPRMGAFVSLFALCIISAIASDLFEFEARALIGLSGILLLCVLVFVNGLGVPMPVLGTWLEPVLGPVVYPVTAVFRGAVGSIFGLLSFKTWLLVLAPLVAAGVFYSSKQ
jgi:hypothetical protein